jgi:ribosomal protein S18 acetylase RimI-like enzyme
MIGQAMKPTLTPFEYPGDFLRVRDFLSQSHSRDQRAVNWDIARWEYAFQFIAPYLANWAEQPPTQHSVDKTMQFMESLTGVWKTTNGEIAGVVNIEHPDLTHPDFGEFFVQRHPDHLDLLPEMLDFAETRLIDPGQNRLFIYIEPDDDPLRQLLEQRGFEPFQEQTSTESLFDLTANPLPELPDLPEGFRIQSMADDNDLSSRCKAFGRSFDHMDPLEWPSLIAYEHLQRAPDYKKDQDIVVVAPNGEFASFCLIWFDEANKLAVLEPVGTQPEFRRMGLARQAIFEAMRRITSKGAERMSVGSGAHLYQALGFKPASRRIRFAKQYH